MKVYRYTTTIGYIIDWSEVNWDSIDESSIDEEAERLYLLLYELRKELVDVIKIVPIEILHRLIKALQVFMENIESLPSIIQEEIEMYFYYENIEQKILEHRNLNWDEVIES